MTDEDLEAELENLKGQYPAEVTGRAAKLGDVANIDYVGTKDGEAFSGGTAEALTWPWEAAPSSTVLRTELWE